MNNRDEARQRVGVGGIGGFGAAHHEALWALEREGVLRVAASCDPRAASLEDSCRKFEFAERGVAVTSTFEEMLDHGCDWATVAAPIPAHAPLHRLCVERGVPCYLEKPPTLDPVELEEMIALDQRASRRTQVGFCYTYEPERLALKTRLLAGEFGPLRRVSLRGAWCRSEEYYARSPWAGRLMQGDTLVLDSCLGNAISHHVQNVLFFAGADSLGTWGECRSVEAMLLRANAIEGADTVFLRGESSGGIELRIALTHACEALYDTEERIECERAVIRITPYETISITHADGREEVLPIGKRDLLMENMRHFASYVRGDSETIFCDLADCRPFVTLHALAYLSSSRITTVRPEHAQTAPNFRGEPSRRIEGIERLQREFVDSGDLRPLSDLVPSFTAPILVHPHDLPRLRQTVQVMKSAEG